MDKLRVLISCKLGDAAMKRFAFAETDRRSRFREHR